MGEGWSPGEKFSRMCIGGLCHFWIVTQAVALLKEEKKRKKRC